MIHVVHSITNLIMYYPSKYDMKQALGSAVKCIVNCMTEYLCLYATNYVNRYVRRRLEDLNLDYYEKLVCMYLINTVTKYVLYHCIVIMRKQTKQVCHEFYKIPIHKEIII